MIADVRQNIHAAFQLLDFLSETWLAVTFKTFGNEVSCGLSNLPPLFGSDRFDPFAQVVRQPEVEAFRFDLGFFAWHKIVEQGGPRNGYPVCC